jgi:predicted nucleotidyltransferase
MHPSNNFGITEKSYGIILSAIKQFPEIEKAVIFGSRATGNYKKGSDIDIAISGTKVTFDTVARLQGVLNEQSPIPYFVDIIDFNNCNHPELKKHIEENGITFFEK